MGTYHSIFKLSGKVGDQVFYMLNGKPVVRRLPKKKKGAKSSARQEVAKTNSEFGKASAAGKILRTALAEEFGALNDRLLYQNINRLMLALKACDGAQPGEKTVQGGVVTAEGAALLADFTFIKTRADVPQLKSAVVGRNGVRVELCNRNSAGCSLTELQINFDNGKFRKHTVLFPDDRVWTFRKKFRRKKGFITLFFLHGNGGLSGVVEWGSA